MPLENISDGGPAFPCEALYSDDPALTRTGEASNGMSLRDYFAAAALQGLISNMTYGGELRRIFDAERRVADATGEKLRTPQEYVSALAFDFADAMLAARKGT